MQIIPFHLPGLTTAIRRCDFVEDEKEFHMYINIVTLFLTTYFFKYNRKECIQTRINEVMTSIITKSSSSILMVIWLHTQAMWRQHDTG